MTTQTQRKYLSIFKGGHTFMFFYTDETQVELGEMIVKAVSDLTNNLNETDMAGLKMLFDWQQRNG